MSESFIKSKTNSPDSYQKLEEALYPWSFTKLKSSSCPYYVNKMAETDRLRDFKGDLATKMGGGFLYAGIAIHNYIEQWLKYNMGEAEKPELADAMRYCQNIEDEEFKLLVEQVEMAHECFSFSQGVPNFHGGKIVGVEDEIHVDKAWNFVDHEKGDVGYFKATIDMIQWDEEDRCITITDHKRQWNILSETDLNKHLQMCIYGSLALAKYPHARKIVLRMYFARFGFYKEVTKFPLDFKSFPETARQMISRNCMRIFDQIDDPQVNVGSQCSICQYANMCPGLTKNPLIDGRIVRKEDAVKVANDLYLAKRQVSDMESVLKEWCSENGPLSVNDKSYGFAPQKTPSYECHDMTGFISSLRDMQQSEETADHLAELGINYKDYLCVDNKMAKKLITKLKKDGDIAVYTEVLKYFTEKKSTRFRVH